MKLPGHFALAAALLAGTAAPATAQDSPTTWVRPVTLAKDTKGTPDARAAQMLLQMTLDEKLTLLKGYFGTDFGATFKAPAEARYGSAGVVPGIPRLGIPAQWQADAGVGVATQGGARDKRPRTALPSGISLAATWDPALVRKGGAMIGAEARADGFNVLLAGGVNLLREPRNGRNFEYGGEDPWLAGSIIGAAIAGIQSNRIVSTAKHYAVNDQETDRGAGSSNIAEPALRMSDLLAFQFTLEAGDPGSVMCAYNKVNGVYACEHPFLLTQVLRNEWKWPGYVMTDWGAAHSTAASVNAGLDQESGYGLQRADWFGADKLKAALADGSIKPGQIEAMAARVLRTLFAHGLIDDPATEGHAIDFARHRAVSREASEAGIVLLKNERNLLPLAASARRIAVIGGHADKGVLSGGGSSQVYPEGENAVPGLQPTGWPGPVVYYPSSPVEELKKLLPQAEIHYVDGADYEEAFREAAAADVTFVFATQWATESIDVHMALDGDQDTLIESVANASRNVVVVLETGGPVAMPWAGRVPGIVQAWFPGRAGGEAIARVLTGVVNPSGHLPATFPKSLDQLPHPEEPKKGAIEYTEGATVGYKWFDAKGIEPLFPFGHGLSYTTFAYRGLAAARHGEGVSVTVQVQNTGQRAGADVVQFYVEGPADDHWEAPRRLAGYAKVDLKPGETRRVTIDVDPRLLSVWLAERPGWTRVGGVYKLWAAHSSRERGEPVTIELPAGFLPKEWKP